MKRRLILTALVVVAWLIAGAVYNAAQGPIQGGASIGQLNGGNAEYVAARTVATTNVVPLAINIVAIAALAIVWLPALVRSRNHSPNQGS